MPSAVYDFIKETGRLPSPAGVALELVNIAGSESATTAEVANVASRDPAISAQLLKLANSPLKGATRRVGSVQQAAAFLGLRTVRLTALGFALVSGYRQGRCARFDYDRFWSSSLACATAARPLAEWTRRFAPDEAFMCGLLGRIGRLALATVFPDEYTTVLRQAEAIAPADLLTAERDAFGITSDELSVEMLIDWGIPDILCRAVELRAFTSLRSTPTDERSEQMARVLVLADAIAVLLTSTAPHEDAMVQICIDAERFGLPAHEFRDFLELIGGTWRDLGTTLSVQTRSEGSLAELYAEAAAIRERIKAQGDRSPEQIDWAAVAVPRVG